MKNLFNAIVKKIFGLIRQEPNIDILKKNGLEVGKNFKMLSQCIIDYSHCWHITIGDNVTFAPRVHILAHDASTWTHLGYTKVGNVIIGNNVFVGAGTIILPGVEIGNDCIIGAASLVNRSIPSGHLAAGNPARIIMSTEDYLQKQRSKMTMTNCFDDSYTISSNVSLSKKQEMINAVANSGIAFVK